jgi:multidrug efflux pump subunit AcrB
VEDIKDRVESVPGVLEAKILGDREREIRVEVNIDRLNAYKIPVTRIFSLISGENKTVSAGNLEMLGGKFQIRVPGEFESPDEIKKLVVGGGETGGPVYLSDIAAITDTFKDRVSISRIQGRPCISLMVQKRSGQNVIKVTNGVKKVLEEEKAKLPSGVNYLITSDLSVDTYGMLYELENNIISGLILVLFVLFLVMGVRNSLLVAFAIPMSIMITMAILQAVSISLNMVVLFSLILVLGMLVDNAIVIVENSFRHRNLGNDTHTSALLGASEVTMAITGSSATTALAFIPLLFWPDVIGKFMWYFPITLITALTASLFVALVINPVLCSIWLEPARKVSRLGDMLHKTGDKFLSWYVSALKVCLKYPKSLFAFFALALIVITLLYFKFGAGVELFPEVDPRRANIYIELPEGTRIEKTDSIVSDIEKRLSKYSDIEYYLTTVGSGGGSYFKGGKSGTNMASILVEFKKFEDRRFPSKVLADAIRMNLNGLGEISIKKARQKEITISGGKSGVSAIKLLLEAVLKDKVQKIRIKTENSNGKSILLPENDYESVRAVLMTATTPFPGAEIIVKKEKKGPPTGSAIKIEIAGDDYRILGELSQQVEDIMSEIPGLTDLTDDLVEGLPELNFAIDKRRAAIFDLDTSTIATFIRAAINGIDAGKYREGEDEYDITIRLPESQRLDTNALSKMRIPNKTGNSIPLSSIGKFSFSEGYGTIKRKNQRRTITVEAETLDGYGTDDVLKAMSAKIAGVPFPLGYSINFTGENEDQTENFNFLMKSFFIASGLILIILVVQFNSVLLTLIIFSSVVLSFIGVFAGLLTLDMRFSVIMTGLGIISLAGIAVNNAIVLIDFAQQFKAKGHSAYEAAIESGKIRLRPVLLTTITTVLGLIPMAVGWTLEVHSFPPKIIAGAESSQWWAPMAIVVIFGLSVSTLLTLFLSPTLFCFFDGLREKTNKYLSIGKQ